MSLKIYCHKEGLMYLIRVKLSKECHRIHLCSIQLLKIFLKDWMCFYEHIKFKTNNIASYGMHNSTDLSTKFSFNSLLDSSSSSFTCLYICMYLSVFNAAKPSSSDSSNCWVEHFCYVRSVKGAHILYPKIKALKPKFVPDFRFVKIWMLMLLCRIQGQL